ncbi:DNA translocase FtsK [Bacillus sp. REN10]|uniref:DNA translocase FtsK n=1 Tax=Bacillus sp. REN10 TaxID=2782541 RepID=UPI00193C52C0|nr:DNA translocase FtsK [Bacillus sp. REN10]
MELFREEIEIEIDEEEVETTKELKEETKEQITEQREEEKKRSFPSLKLKQNDSPEMVTKVTYQYPSREFRFPAYSNEWTRPKRERVRRESFGEEEQTARKVYSTASSTTSENRVSKRPFRPSEIASPIHGFKQRPVKKEETTAPSMKQETVSKPAVTEEPLLLFKEEKKQKVFDIEAVSPVLSPAVKQEMVQVDEPAEMVQDLSSTEVEKPPVSAIINQNAQQPKENVHSVVEESIQAEEQPAEILANPQELAAPHSNKEGKLPEEKAHSRAEERKQRRRQTPFNVIMSKQDRDLWKQKQEQKKEEISMTSAVFKEEETQATVTISAAQPPKEMEALPEQSQKEPAVENYVFPHISYLQPPSYQEASHEWVEHQSQVLNETFKNFNVKASVVNVTVGPSVTRFEVEPEPGVKVSKITNLSDDIKLSLAARNLRIEAPIPGTQVIGIEVPNKESRPVLISEIIKSREFDDDPSPLTSALGLNISGDPVVLDLKKMPHGLIAGATGSGKSVCINSILVSLLYKAAPHELKLLLIDPKMVELAPYNGIPHLVSPVITDVKAATAALKWAVEEMERRYELFVHAGVRDITKFNEKAAKLGNKSEHLPFIVIIIDELADLMMMSPVDVEEAICRIAQKARACGIHLIVATQRPSVDVITGLIKANIPTRIAFSVSSQVDSRTIIDSGGAEKLLGRGDMLFLNNGSSETVRLQGTFVSDDEIDAVVEHVRKEQQPNYLFKQEELLKKAQVQEVEDELFPEACEFIVHQGGASTSLLQRHFKIGYNRAARLIEMMESQGLISEQRAGKPREVLVSEEELQTINDTSTI